MATIKKLGMGRHQYGGFTPDGNLTTYRAQLVTLASGAAANSDTPATPLGVGDVVYLERLPQGMVLEDAQAIVSTALTALVTGSLGFVYVDGVDDATVPQDPAYFGAGMALNATGRIRATGAKAPVKLPKEAYLTLTIAGAANAKAGQVDFIVHGERMGPK